MTENEAIEIIRDKIETCEFYFAEHDRYPEWCEYEFLEALGIAISTLKEIQQYREIGTVEEVEQNARDLKRQIEHSEHLAEVLKSTQNLLRKRDQLLKDYCKIGTVEECRAAVEKQKAKKPKKKLDKYSNTYKCPNCDFKFIHKNETGWFCGKCYKYCPDCGQAIDWSEEE